MSLATRSGDAATSPSALTKVARRKGFVSTTTGGRTQRFANANAANKPIAPAPITSVRASAKGRTSARSAKASAWITVAAGSVKAAARSEIESGTGIKHWRGTAKRWAKAPGRLMPIIVRFEHRLVRPSAQ